MIDKLDNSKLVTALDAGILAQEQLKFILDMLKYLNNSVSENETSVPAIFIRSWLTAIVSGLKEKQEIFKKQHEV